MEREEVLARIREAIPQAGEIQVEGAECDFTAVVVSETFDGLSQVKRQQQVLAAFADALGSGELHALSVKAYTAPELERQQGGSLTQISL